MTDLYVPAMCKACGRIALIQAVDGVAACPRCSSSVAVVPGEAYRAADVPLFKRIESIIHDSELSPEDGGRIVNALTDVTRRIRHPERCMLTVVKLIPSLSFLPESLANQRARLARAAGMVLAIVWARNQRSRARPQLADDPTVAAP